MQGVIKYEQQWYCLLCYEKKSTSNFNQMAEKFSIVRGVMV